MAATGINKGACPFHVACMVWRHFHVPERNFEEILQHLKKRKKKKKNTEKIL